MNVLPNHEKSLVLSLLSEGNSIRSIERMSGIHRDTIMKLTLFMGEQCREFLNREMVNLRVGRLQVDEIWCYVAKKQKRLTEQEQQNPELGDQYVFVALDADTKLIPAFRLGKRTSKLAASFMMELSTRIATKFQLTTDSFPGYRDAIDRVYGNDIAYAQIHKVFREDTKEEMRRYSPGKIIRVTKNIMTGEPDPKHISTSYIERQNLTMRMQMRRFTRLTNAYSKKWQNLHGALSLYFWHYNFARVHESLRCTPAMEAGVSRHIWTWEELLQYNEQQEAA